MKWSWKSIRLPSIAMLTVFVIIAGALAFGFLDIALSQFDDRRGILTQKAIEAVRQLPEGDATIAAAVAAQRGASKWHAYHGQDDSLRVVVVTVGGWPDPRLAPQWCVEFGFDWRSRGFSVRRIAPINLAAQDIAPTLGSQFEPLNAYGTSWCAGGAAKYRKRTVIDPSR